MPQIWLYGFIRDLSHAPSLAQAEKFKRYQGDSKLTKEVIMTEDSRAGATISIKAKYIEKYFPPNTGKQEAEDTIIKLLDH